MTESGGVLAHPEFDATFEMHPCVPPSVRARMEKQYLVPGRNPSNVVELGEPIGGVTLTGPQPVRLSGETMADPSFAISLTEISNHML